MGRALAPHNPNSHVNKALSARDESGAVPATDKELEAVVLTGLGQQREKKHLWWRGEKKSHFRSESSKFPYSLRCSSCSHS